MNPTSTSSKSSINNDRFLYPSFCLYSNRALANEYGSESDIVQFLSPETESLKERLPIFVGILQSLFTVANEMPFSHTCTEEDEEEMNEVEDEEDCDSNSWSPFTIVGLDSMKLVVWPNMYDNILENTTEKDLCLVVIVSAQLQDSKIIHSMDLLKDSLNDTPCTLTGKELGEELIPLDLNKSFEQWVASEMSRGKKRKAPFEEYNDSPTASTKSLRLSNSEGNIVNEEQQNEEKDKYKNMLMMQD
ncbi:hypothetical protein G6F43_007323 [Rhizopus delemar]|nr:hypothetical protein G6F43_007323 [Rhizopus delemar]